MRIKTLCHANGLQEAVDTFKHLLSAESKSTPSLMTCNLLLSTLVQQSRHESMLFIYRLMGEKDIVPDLITLNIIINSHWNSFCWHVGILLENFKNWDRVSQRGLHIVLKIVATQPPSTNWRSQTNKMETHGPFVPRPLSNPLGLFQWWKSTKLHRKPVLLTSSSVWALVHWNADYVVQEEDQYLSHAALPDPPIDTCIDPRMWDQLTMVSLYSQTISKTFTKTCSTIFPS